MSRKNLEIQLSQLIRTFDNPKINLEQYQTPPRVAANLLHIAWTRGHIADKTVVDLCAGTGILGLGAVLLGGDVTLVEVDEDALSILHDNKSRISKPVDIIAENVLTWEPHRRFDTAILNPPFGIQQQKVSDMAFVNAASEIADHIYSIHDGSKSNQERLPDIFKANGLDIIEAYLDEFPLDRTYPWHSKDKKNYRVLIIHSKS